MNCSLASRIGPAGTQKNQEHKVCTQTYQYVHLLFCFMHPAGPPERCRFAAGKTHTSSSSNKFIMIKFIMTV